MHDTPPKRRLLTPGRNPLSCSPYVAMVIPTFETVNHLLLGERPEDSMKFFTAPPLNELTGWLDCETTGGTQ